MEKKLLPTLKRKVTDEEKRGRLLVQKNESGLFDIVGFKDGEKTLLGRSLTAEEVQELARNYLEVIK